MNRPLAIAGLIAATFALSACSSSPTGRSQMLLYSQQDMSQLGAQSFDALKQQEKIYTDKKPISTYSVLRNLSRKNSPAQKQQSNGKWWCLTVIR
ncbi:Zn-dependent protease [Photobacterium aphoticum]|uniref:Zn-dependent protease n=1 Tax=Photobacterium aphoticum TaxID=754436 RepID=A0A090QM59_9GAMM|nr:Zn-dependent protease [Photobacterium aphoticum]